MIGRRRDPMPPGCERVITVMGIAGETYWEAFRGWVTRIRRHVAWRLVRPEFAAYRALTERKIGLDEEAGRVERAQGSRRTLQTLRGLETWLTGPSGWSELSLAGWLTRGIWNRHRQ